MAGIFISYRRQDSAGWAGHLSDILQENFGPEQIFMDIETIEAGVDFIEMIRKAVGSCDVLIAVIGPQWLAASDANGRRRLDNANDFIRLEIATALQRNIRVIPVLVGGAAMPSEEDLPPDLAALARRQADELSDKRWEFDTEQLVKILVKTLGRPSLKGRAQVKSVSPLSPIQTVPVPLKKLSVKAIMSLSLILFLLILFFTEESLDWNTVMGGLVFAFVALALGIVAFYDAKLNKVKGMGLAITGIVLSAIMALALIGKSPLTTDNVDSPARNQEQSARLEPSGSKTPVTVPNEQSASAPLSDSRTSPLRTELQHPNLDITGTWESVDGFTYEFEQRGNHVQLAVKNGYGVLVSSGEGSIIGQRVELSYVLSDFTGGGVQLTVSAEGNEMHGMYRNVTTGLSGSIVLRR